MGNFHMQTIPAALPENENGITNARAADAQRWSGGPLKRMVLLTKTRLGLSACRTDLVFEDCVKHRGVYGSADRGREDIRPRPQAGTGCVRSGKNPRTETRNFAPRHGAWGTGSNLLKGRLISWFNARFFFAGTALNSKSEKLTN